MFPGRKYHTNGTRHTERGLEVGDPEDFGFTNTKRFFCSVGVLRPSRVIELHRPELPRETNGPLVLAQVHYCRMCDTWTVAARKSRY